MGQLKTEMENPDKIGEGYSSRTRKTYLELLGHSNIKTTQVYTHVAKQQTEKIISPLDQIMKKKGG